MKFDEAFRLSKSHLCAVCWQHLYLPHGADRPLCSAYGDEHQGYVTTSYVERRKQEDEIDYREAKDVLTKAGVLPEPVRQTPNKNLKDLGF